MSAEMKKASTPGRQMDPATVELPTLLTLQEIGECYAAHALQIPQAPSRDASDSEQQEYYSATYLPQMAIRITIANEEVRRIAKEVCAGNLTIRNRKDIRPVTNPGDILENDLRDYRMLLADAITYIAERGCMSRAEAMAILNFDSQEQTIQKAKTRTPVQSLQEQEILRLIVEIGADPMSLPVEANGKAGIKSQIRKIALPLPAFLQSDKAFDKAWERLLNSGRLKRSF